MFFKHKKILFLFILLGLFLFEVDFAFALEIKNYPPVLGVTMPANPGLPDYARYFFNLGMSLAVSLAALVIIIGGIYWIVSLGRGKITHEGKEWVMAGIKGLVLLLCSYLIAVTINPALVHPKLEGLTRVLPWAGQPTQPTTPSIPTITYQEIPIGTLTETTLTRTMDCYDFDFKGDPIDGNPNTPGWEPTFMDHDRVDCISKLSEAIEKKAEIFKDLSEKIAELMNSCTCFGVCDLNCTTCSYSGPCPRPDADKGTNTPCQGDCVNAPCKGDKDCCLPGVKEKIEHGPITLKSCPEDSGKDYKGLDEFRTSRTTISPFVEEEVEINKKKVIVIKKEGWGKLKLIEQLMYLKEKLSKLKEEFESDLNLLKTAEDKMGKCYLVKSYSEFLKLAEKIDKKDAKIVVQKIFKDPLTKKGIDASKYCKGFGYADASIFNTCKKICSPGANLNSFDALKKSYFFCGGDLDCIAENYYLCGDNNFGYEFFQDCLVGMTEKCKDDCEKKYPNCPDPLQKCKDLCDKDSSFLDREDCYVNFQVVQECASTYSALEDFKRCVESSMCVYCTDQYAGYPDCLTDTTLNYSNYSALYFYQHPTLQKDYLSSFFATIKGKSIVPPVYPESRKCPFFSKCPKCPCKNATCSGYGGLEEKRLFCNGDCGEYAYDGDPLTFYCQTDWWQEAYGEIGDATDTPSPEDAELSKEATGIIKGELEAEDEPTGLAESLTEAEKNELLQEEGLKTLFWAVTMRCPRENEIPIGQTVDEAEAWAKELLKYIDDFVKKTEDMVQYINKIGKEKNYCECNSKCNGDEPACEADCTFWQQEVPVFDEDGNQIGTTWVCGCNTQPCDGNPCQKMINLLMGKTASKKCPKNIKLCGVPCYYSEKEEKCPDKCDANKFGLKETLEKLKEFATKESRSEILKKLIYSRKKMDECSALSGVFKGETNLISCTRIKDYNIDPISTWKTIIQETPLRGFCYGRWISRIFGSEPLMDNWGCCEPKIKQ